MPPRREQIGRAQQQPRTARGRYAPFLPQESACSECGTHESVQWRNVGGRRVCNACGIRIYRSRPRCRRCRVDIEEGRTWCDDCLIFAGSSEARDSPEPVHRAAEVQPEPVEPRVVQQPEEEQPARNVCDRCGENRRLEWESEGKWWCTECALGCVLQAGTGLITTIHEGRAISLRYHSTSILEEPGPSVQETRTSHSSRDLCDNSSIQVAMVSPGFDQGLDAHQAERVTGPSTTVVGVSQEHPEQIPTYGMVESRSGAGPSSSVQTASLIGVRADMGQLEQESGAIR